MRTSFLRAILILFLYLATSYASTAAADLSVGGVGDIGASRVAVVPSNAGEPLPVAASPRPGLPPELIGFDTGSVAVDMAMFRRSSTATPPRPTSSRGLQGLTDVSKYFEVEFPLFDGDEPVWTFVAVAALACLAFAGFATARRFVSR